LSNFVRPELCDRLNTDIEIRNFKQFHNHGTGYEII